MYIFFGVVLYLDYLCDIFRIVSSSCLGRLLFTDYPISTMLVFGLSIYIIKIIFDSKRSQI